MAREEFPAYHEEQTPDGRKKKVIGPVVVRAAVIIVAMILGTVLLISGTLKPADLPNIKLPWP
jgi:hypothetical protein